jgi:hypothetical protein
MKQNLLLYYNSCKSLSRNGNIRCCNLAGYILLALFLIGFANPAAAQLSEIWRTPALTVDGQENIWIVSQAVDHEQNLIVLGYSGANTAERRITLHKIDPAGGILWARTYAGETGSISNDPSALQLDSKGNIYISGTSDMAGTYQRFLLRYSTSGALVWNKSYSYAAGANELQNFTVGKDDAIYLTGVTKDDQKTNIITRKLGATGAVVWEKQFVPEAFDLGEEAVIDVDNKGAVFVATNARGYQSNYNFTLLKYSAATGDVLLTQQYGSNTLPSREMMERLLISPSGNVFVFTSAKNSALSANYTDLFLYMIESTGNLQNKVRASEGVAYKDGIPIFYLTDAKFNAKNELILLVTNARYRSHYDYFISKYSADGTRAWVKTLNVYEGSNIKQFVAKDLDILDNQEIAVIGEYSVFVELNGFPPVRNVIETPKLILALFDQSGNETWRHLNQKNNDVANYGTQISKIEGKSVYATGGVSGTQPNIFAMKFSDCSTLQANAGTDKEICTGGNVQLQASGGTTYSWSPATGLSATNVANPVASPTETTTYTVTVTNADGCTGTDQVVVNVNTAPTASISVNGSTSLCAGGSVSLEANAGTGYTYQWLRSGSIINNATGNTYSATTAGDYTVIVENTAGCSTTSAAVKVAVAPVVTASAGADKEICTGENVQLQASGGTTYSWAPATGLSATNIANPIASPTTTTTYTVIVTNADGCTDTDEVIVKVNEKPTATITAESETTLCHGGSVLLKATSGTYYSYQWLKNGTPIAQATASTYSAETAGDYSVIVKNAGECSATSAVVKVDLAAAVTASAGTDKEICAGGDVQLQASGGTTYSWSPATGLSATNVANPVASPTSTTTYIVTVSNANGCSATDEVTVKVTANPTASIIADGATTFCEGGSLVLRANQGTGYSYQWFKDGNPINQATGSSFTTFTAGEYTVKVTMGSGCTATSSPVKVTLNKPATVVAGAAQSICANAVAFMLSGFSPAGGTWSGTGVSEAGLFNPTIAGVGTHTLTYTVNQDNCSATATKMITVTPTIATPGTINGTAAVCSGVTNLAYTINAVAGADSYTWTVPTGFTITSGQGTTSIKVTAGGNGGNITVTANSGCGASEASTIAVNVNTLAAATITAEGSTTFCEGGSVTLKATAGTNYSYQWLRNGAAISEATAANYSATVAGNYTVRISIGSCAETSAPIAVNVTSGISNNAIATGNQSVCVGTAVANLQGSVPTGGSGNYSYQWQQSSDGTSFSSINGATSQNYNPGNLSSTTWFRRVVTAGGCSSTSEAVKVTINAGPTVALSTFGKVCTDSEVLTLTGGQPAGGTYSGTGISNGVFSPATAGVGTHTITYTFTDGSGCSATATQTIVVEAECNVTGVEEDEPAHKFVFFPNPAKDKLNLEVELPDRTDVTIQLMDARGSIILQKEFSGQVGAFKEVLQLQNIARGMYFLRFTTKDGAYNRKVVLR